MDGLVSLSNLRQQGYTRRAIHRAEADGSLRPVRRGWWLVPSPAGPHLDHLARLRAALAVAHPTAAASHVSAALSWGLPLRATTPTVWLTRDGHGGGHERAGVHTVLAQLPETDVVLHDGMRTTALARTVVDVGRTRDHVEAVMVADAALHRGLAPSSLAAQLTTMHRWPGVARARLAVDFADGRSESPYESWTRVLLARMGLPAPTPQREVFGPGGRFVARVDLALDEWQLAIEYDGQAKYDVLTRDRSTPGEVFAREKRRDRELSTLGWHVLHLAKEEIHDERRFRAVVGRAVDDARRANLRGD